MTNSVSSVPGAPGMRLPFRQGPWLTLALALTCALSLVFPGDAPWVNDEPKLILAALQANSAHTLAQQGLQGTRYVAYGPLAVWIYQALLLVSHDLRVIVVLHALLMSAGTALALFWLARESRLWPWFAVVIALSPYLWLYNRVLWDNTFNIPLSALALAGYAAFLSRRSAVGLLVTVCCLLTEPLVHFMSLALVVPFAVHLLVFERRALRQRKWALLAVLAIAATAYGYYGRALYSDYLKPLFALARSANLAPAGQPIEVPGFGLGFVFPLLGGRLLSASGLDNSFATFFGDSPLLRIALEVTIIAFPLVWWGIVLSVWRLVRALRTKHADSLDHLAGLCLAIFVAQVLLNGVTNTYAHPHYFSATWIAYAFFAWLSADALAKVRPLRWLIPLHGAALGAVSLWLVILVHATDGTRSHYGPTLKNQMEIAAEINRYAPGSAVTSDVENLAKFPHSISVLRILDGPATRPTLPARELLIRYSSADPRSGRAEVVPR